VDETYVRAVKWTYLYRAVDPSGDTIDFMLSPKRDLTAATLFLRLALLGSGGVRPRVVNVDRHPAKKATLLMFGSAIGRVEREDEPADHGEHFSGGHIPASNKGVGSHPEGLNNPTQSGGF
jgi:transposase-like protein